MALRRPIAHPLFPLALLSLLVGSPTALIAQPATPEPAAEPAARAAAEHATAEALACAAARADAESARAQLLEAAPRLAALLLAEIHTSAADHAWQLDALQAVAARRRRLALGLEMVPAARQAALDRFNRGQSDEATLLKEVGWQEVWGHDPELYLPLLRWARREGVPLLGLNAEPELVRRVRARGLAAIPPAERQGIGTPAPAGGAYRERLRQAWQGHGGGATSGSAPAAAAADLERFIESQLLRDRAMAEAIARARRRHPERLVVALIGRGHLERGTGVPDQLQALRIAPVLVAGRPALPPGCEPAPARARLGVYLESVDGAVWVRQVAPGSPAAAAGLRPGDRLLELNGEPVQRAGQVIRRVGLQPAGVPLLLRLERNGRIQTLRLTLPPATEPPR